MFTLIHPLQSVKSFSTICQWASICAQFFLSFLSVSPVVQAHFLTMGGANVYTHRVSKFQCFYNFTLVSLFASFVQSLSNFQHQLTVASQHKSPGFDTRLDRDLPVWSFNVLPVSSWALCRYSGFLHSPKTCRLIGDSKLPVGVNVSVNGCLSLYVSPVMNWRLVQGEPRPRPVSAGTGSKPPRPCKGLSVTDNEWMNILSVPVKYYHVHQQQFKPQLWQQYDYYYKVKDVKLSIFNAFGCTEQHVTEDASSLCVNAAWW